MSEEDKEKTVDTNTVDVEGTFDLGLCGLEVIEENEQGEWKVVKNRRSSSKKVMDLMAVDHPRWEKVRLYMDSGAMETVIPPSEAKSIKTRKDDGMSKVQYRVANGEVIPNLGVKRMTWKSEEGFLGKMDAQVTAVTKPLASIGKICDAGNQVMMGPNGGWIENLKTKQKTAIHRVGRQYVMDIEVRARDEEDQLMAVTCQRCEVKEGPDFTWQDFLP